MSMVIAWGAWCLSNVRTVVRLGTKTARIPQYLHKNLSHSAHKIRICVIGSGPGGFYTAQGLLKNPNVQVDIYEKLPVPFGLVRFGVAPDHPEVKNVISTFSKTASNSNCHYFGNVCIGKDITISELQEAYNGIILSYGAEKDRRLGIPGEDAANVVSARKFVGWYNGLPEDVALSIDLNVETAVVIGLGNVALDVARILLSPVDKLRETDITEHAMEALIKSRVRRVVIVGRRGPLQVAFTIKELREMTKLEGCRSLLRHQDFQDIEAIMPSLPRPRKRITELMVQTSKQESGSTSYSKEWELKLLRTPLEVLVSAEGNKAEGVTLEINQLLDNTVDAQVMGTGEQERIDCGLVLRSIGYKCINLDPLIPFDPSKGILPNTHGKLMNKQGFYCSGWVKTGPVGVILSTMNSSFETAATVLADLENGLISKEEKPGSQLIRKLLQDRGIKAVSFNDWMKIDKWEEEQGKILGKARRKIITREEMLSVAGCA